MPALDPGNGQTAPLRRGRARPRRGFTLLEALMAAGILFVVVVAVTSAVTAGQQHAFEAHVRISGALAAEEWMGRILRTDYGNLVTDWNNITEDPGMMVDEQGVPFPESFFMIGRRASIVAETQEIGDLNIRIDGYEVRVEAFDDRGRTIVMLRRFVPQPAVETIPTALVDGDDEGGLITKVVKKLRGL